MTDEVTFLCSQSVHDDIVSRMQAKVDATVLKEWRTADKLEAAQAVSAEFLQSRVACLQRLDAAQDISNRLAEFLDNERAEGRLKLCDCWCHQDSDGTGYRPPHVPGCVHVEPETSNPEQTSAYNESHETSTDPS